MLGHGDFFIRVSNEEELECVLQQRTWIVSGKLWSTLVEGWYAYAHQPKVKATIWVHLSALGAIPRNDKVFYCVASRLKEDFLGVDGPTKDVRIGCARISIDFPIRADL